MRIPEKLATAAEAALSGKHVLIVHDDAPLDPVSDRLSVLMKGYGGLPVNAFSMEGATKIVLAKTPDLAIIDVDLPATDEDYIKAQDLTRDLAVIRRALDTLFETQKSVEIGNLRYRRSRALEQISNLIKLRGGFDLADNWSLMGLPLVMMVNESNDPRLYSVSRSYLPPMTWFAKPHNNDHILCGCIGVLSGKLPRSMSIDDLIRQLKLKF